MRTRATVLRAIAIAALSATTAAGSDCPRPVVPAAKNVVINAEITRQRLPVPSGALRSKTELVLRNIKFDTHPGSQFHVILERPDDPARRARVGTLSFYAGSARTTTSRTFDVTDELRAIAANREVNVVFEATTGRGGAGAKPTFDPDSKVTVGELALRVRMK